MEVGWWLVVFGMQPRRVPLLSQSPESPSASGLRLASWYPERPPGLQASPPSAGQARTSTSPQLPAANVRCPPPTNHKLSHCPNPTMVPEPHRA